MFLGFVCLQHVCGSDRRSLCAYGVYVFPGQSCVRRGTGPESALPDGTEKEHEQVSLGGKIGPFKL